MQIRVRFLLIYSRIKIIQSQKGNILEEIIAKIDFMLTLGWQGTGCRNYCPHFTDEGTEAQGD